MSKVGKRSNGKINGYHVSGLCKQPVNDCHAADDADVHFTKTRMSKSSRKSNKPTKLEDVPDSEEDPGHLASL